MEKPRHGEMACFINTFISPSALYQAVSRPSRPRLYIVIFLVLTPWCLACHLKRSITEMFIATLHAACCVCGELLETLDVFGVVSLSGNVCLSFILQALGESV